MPDFKIEHIHKYYKQRHALNDVCLDFSGKHFIVLAGPSGCGKSTLLNVLAGFLQADEGTILLDGQRIDQLPSAQREIAMVFQEDALFPHMSVHDNITFGLAYGGMKQEEIKLRVKDITKMLKIDELMNRRSSSLSTGQKQRVSMARALVRSPKLFLMDEPLSALDARLKTELRIELSELFKKLDATFLYVTHDQVEAMTLADTLIIMKDGVIQQVGNPMDIYQEPKNLFTASFMGKFEINQFVGHMRENNLYWGSRRLLLSEPYANQDIVIAVRMEYIIMDEYGSEGVVALVEHMGDECYYHIKWENQIVIMKGNMHHHIEVQETILFSFPWKYALFFDYEKGQRLYLK